MKKLTANLSEREHFTLFSLIRKYLILYVLFLCFGYGIYAYEVKSAKNLLASFDFNEEIICGNEFVKKASGWKYDKESRVFFNDKYVFHLMNCTQSLIKESK